jgi:hypothetical protein
MSDLISLLVVLLIIYSFLIGFTLLLISKLYKSYFVCGIKTKEIIRRGNFTSPAGDSHDHVTSYFDFKTKEGKKINRGTSLFPMTKKGKKKYFLYNDDKNEIVAKIYTLLWQAFIFGTSLLYSMMVGIPFFVIALVLVVITIWFYSKYYKKKYVKGVK